MLRDGFESFKKALTIVGNDSVMNLKAGEADTAVRYADAAPTWVYWETVARKTHRRVPAIASKVGLSFREELHAIEAVIAGQGVAICSDVWVGREPRLNWRDVLVTKPTHSRLVETPKIAGEQLKRANDGKACQCR